MRFKLPFFISALLCFSARVIGQGQDLTLQEGASGSAVVLASISRIQQSGIFPSDNELLRRIAFVETRDGTNSDTYRAGYHGGIWAVSEVLFQDTQDIATNPSLSSVFQQIDSLFGINWPTVLWNDLRKPLFSALAARIYLNIVPEAIPLATNVQSQGEYWQRNYNPLGSLSDFLSAANELDLLNECSVSGIDLYFVLDSSGSVGSSNFQLMKTFAYNIANGFDIGPEDTQVGVISFSSSARFHFRLNTYHNKASLLSAINSISYISGGTNTAAGLDLLRLQGYTSGNGGRPLTQAIPRVAVVVTDGFSNSFSATVTAANNVHSAGIQAFAVGVGSNVNNAELDAIASDPSFVSLLSGFDSSQFDNLQRAISSETCTAAAEVPITMTVSDTVESGEMKYFTYPFPDEGLTIKLDVNDGSAVLYASDIIQTPNEALYDWRIETDGYSDVFLDPTELGRPVAGDNVFVSVEGLEASNSFSIDTTFGDTSTNPPDAPTNVQITSVTTTMASVMWVPPVISNPNALTNIVSYTIRLMEMQYGLPNISITVSSSSTSYTFSGLEEFNTYICSVAAVNGVGTGSFFSVNFTTLQAPPTAPPQMVSGLAQSPTLIRFTWSAPPAIHINGIIQFYEVHLIEIQTGRSWMFVAVDNFINVGALRPYHFYDFQVAASTTDIGPFSSPILVPSGETAPSAAPENITITDITSRSISLSWDPPHPDDQNGIIRQYIISINEIITSNMFTVTSTTTSVLVDNLHPFYSYTISLAAETNEVGPFSPLISIDLPEDAPDAPPRNVNGFASSATTISLNWDPPLIEEQNGVIREYLINVTENETGNSFQLSVIETMITLSSLHPAYTYECRVSAVTTGASPFSVTVSITTLEAAPSAPPQSFAAIPTSSQSVDLLWDPPLTDTQNGVIIGYIINVTVLETGEMFQLFSDTNSLGLNFLQPFTTYICVIAAQTAAGVGPYSITYQVTTLEDLPSEPESLLVMTVQGSPSQLQVSWDPPSQPNGVILSYSIYCSYITTNDGSGSGSNDQILYPVDMNDALQLVVVSGNVTEATVSGLIPYTQYNCYITANTSVGEGNVSVTLLARTDESTPGDSPENFQVSDVTPTAVSLTWSNPLIPNGIITSFTVTYNASGIIQSTTLSADTRSLLITGLEEYTVYVFAISASTRIGSGPSTEILLRTEESSPHSPPEHVQSIVTSSTSVTISWEPPIFVNQNGPIVYYILVLREQQFNLSDIVVNVTRHTNYTLSSLEEYNTYSYQVAAATRVGLGPYTEPVLFTTFQDVPSAPPQDLSGIAQSSTLLTFIWSPPPSIDINGIIQYYVVMVSEQETGRFWTFFAVDADINLASLHPFFNYECQVAAFTIGSGPYTSSVIVQTDEAAPSGPPTNLGTTNVLSESLSLSWNPPVFEDINGIIRSYTINVTEVETGSVLILRSNTTQVTLTNLHPFYTYACAIAAETVGLGPYTINLVVQLLEEAPTAPPVGLFGYAADSTTIILTWSPPPPENQNGIIRHYVIGVTELDTGTNFTLMSLATQTSIGSLHPFYTYHFTVIAVTVAPGPPSFVTVQTEQDVPSAPPQSVSIVETMATSATLMWDALEAEEQNGIITGYLINVTVVETGERFQSFSTSTTLTLDALRPFTSYICTIAAQTSAGVGPFSITVLVRTEEAAPESSPENLTATSLSSTSISISWSPPPLSSQNGIIREYRINVTEIQTGNVLIFTTSTTSIIVPSLHPYYDYRCTVSAYTVGIGPYSEEFVITTPEDVPSGYPQNFDAVATSSRSATFTWDPPLAEEQNGIIISYVVNITAIETAEMFQLFSEMNSIIVATLSPFTTYNCFISASTSIGNGPFSTVITLRTPEDVPTSPPINPIGIADNLRTITFSWDPPPPREQNGIIREYRVNITEVDTGRMLQFVSTMTSLTIATLHPFYTYEWVVSAYTVGTGPQTQVVTVSTPEDAPDSAPQNLAGEPLSSRDIFLTWESPPPEDWNGIITGYLINITKLITGETQHFVSTSTNLTISSLSPFTLYVCTIAAATSVGNGPFSEVILVQTLEEGPASHPLNTTGISLNSTHIYLEWDAPPQSQQGGVIREYRINVTEFETERVFHFTSELTEITIGPLHPFYTYICVIAAFTVDLGPFSDNIVVITDEAAPSSPPRNLQVVVTNSRSMFITWEPPVPEEQNGILRQYVITLMSVETDEIVTTSSVSTSVTVSGLMPFTTYQCTVAAQTIATGPTSEAVLARTSEDIPTAPPEDLQLNSADSRTLVLTWEPVAMEHTNGIIRRYSVRLIELETGTMLQFLVNDTMFTVSDLHPFYTYSGSVAAETIGLGPFTAEQSVELPEDAPASSPTNIVANNIGATSFLLSWSNPPPEDHNGIIRHYILNITEENTMTTFEMTTATTQMMLLFLHPYYNYSCAVSAVTVQPGPYSLPIQVTTAEDVPVSPPENFQAIADSSTSVIITWDVPPKEDQNGIITGYFIDVEAPETGERFQLFSESNILIVDTLRPFTTYVCIIAAQTSIGIGPYSTSITVRTPEDVPTASPGSLSHTQVLSTSVVLQWNPPPPDQQNGLIRHYIINISELETGQNYSLNSTSTEQIISGLHPFYTYTFSVSAVTIASGPYSEQYTLQTEQDAPSSPPQNLEATAANSRALLLMWNPPPLEEQNGIISIYLINISVFESGDHFQLVSNTTSIVIEELHPYYTYTCIVAAFTVAMGPFTEVYTIQLPEDVPTAPPRNTAGEVLSSTAIFITWQVPPLEEQNGIIQLYFIHLLEIPTNMNFTYQQEGQHTELVIDSLHPDYDYECSVAAETAVGRGPFSEPFTITTHEDVPAGGPQNVMVTAVDSRSISLRWDPPPPESQNGDIQYYIISVMVTESGEQFRLLSNTTNQTIDDLHPFYTYNILISAVTTDSGPASPPFVVRTLEDIPVGVPQSFIAVAVSSSSIRLTWAAPIPEEQNGIVRAYHISITELETGEVLRFQTDGTATLMIINSLHPFYTYNCTLAAYTIGLGPSAYTEIQTLSEPPSDVPENITVIALNATTAQLTWEPPSPEHRNGNIEEYIVTITGVDTNEEYEFHFNQTFATVSDLHPFYRYKFSIAAVTIAVGPFSSSLILQMPETFPGASVQNVTVMVQSPTSVAVSWYPPDVQEWNGIVTGYTVLYEQLGSVDEYPENLELQPVVTFTTSIPLPGVPLLNDPDPRTVSLPLQIETAVVSNLQEYYVYQFAVIFGNSFGESTSTVPIIQEMPQAAPTGPPTNININILSSTSLHIVWQPPNRFERNGMITGYEIQLISGQDEILQVYNVSGVSLSLQIEGLQKYTAYTTRIAARTSIGVGPFSQAAPLARTLEDVPQVPEEVSHELLNETTLVLRWNEPENPNGDILDYQVNYFGYQTPAVVSPVQRRNEPEVEIVDGPYSLNISDGQSTTIYNLVPGLTYTFKVRARTSVGYGDNSTIVTVEITGQVSSPEAGESGSLSSGIIALIVIAILGWFALIIVIAGVIYFTKGHRSKTFNLGDRGATEAGHTLDTFRNTNTNAEDGTTSEKPQLEFQERDDQTTSL